MAGMFYKLGKWVGPTVRKGKWIWSSMTGDEDDMLAAETEAGSDLVEAVLGQVERDTDQQVNQLVHTIGEKVAACVANKKRTFKFYVVKTGDPGEPNAFALPGGHVLLSRSLLELMEFDADEIAFVIGHEMGHVIKKDPMQRIMTDATLSAAAKMTPLRGAVGGWIKKTGMKLMSSAYSQDAEFMADKVGSMLARAAGFDPRAGVAMLARLKELTQAPNAPGSDPLGSYFSTHPPFDLRIKEIEQYMRLK